MARRFAEDSPTITAVRRDIPTDVEHALAKAMAKEPVQRYETAGALAVDLRRARAGETVHALDAAPTRPVPTAPTAATGRRSRRRLLAVVSITVALAVAAGVVAFLAARGGGGAGMDPRLRSFVDRVENVLAQSASGRNEIAAALNGRARCAISAREAGERIGSVADNRQSILEQLGVMQAPTPAGDHVVTLLQQALQQSIEADRHYRDALELTPPAGGCGLPHNASFRLAQASNARATATKRRFVAAFNPLARRFKRRTWSAAEI
jgi:hypothetical protein